MNNKGADQSARIHRLVCTIVIPKPGRQFFSRPGPYNAAFILDHSGPTLVSEVPKVFCFKASEIYTSAGVQFRIGISILKIFIWDEILSDIPSEIMFYSCTHSSP